MNFKIMRVLVFFDLPMETSNERKEYCRFHKFLIKSGFIQMQKSVYSKLAVNKTVSTSIKKIIKKNLPQKGLIQMLEITENQFLDIDYLLGEANTNILDSNKRIVVYD